MTTYYTRPNAPPSAAATLRRIANGLTGAQAWMLTHPVDRTLGGHDIIADRPRRTRYSLMNKGLVNASGQITAIGQRVRVIVEPPATIERRHNASENRYTVDGADTTRQHYLAALEAIDPVLATIARSMKR